MTCCEPRRKDEFLDRDGVYFFATQLKTILDETVEDINHRIAQMSGGIGNLNLATIADIDNMFKDRLGK